VQEVKAQEGVLIHKGAEGRSRVKMVRERALTRKLANGGGKGFVVGTRARQVPDLWPLPSLSCVSRISSTAQDLYLCRQGLAPTQREEDVGEATQGSGMAEEGMRKARRLQQQKRRASRH
jgi:hypothetical protein